MTITSFAVVFGILAILQILGEFLPEWPVVAQGITSFV